MNPSLNNKPNLIWEIWQKHAEINPYKDAIVHWNAGCDPQRLSYSMLLSAAEVYSKILIDSNIKAGEICALIFKHNPEFYPIYLAVVKLGAIPAVLAYPNPRLHPEKFVQGIKGMSQRSGLDWILTDSAIGLIIEPYIKKDTSTIRGFIYPIELTKEHGHHRNLNFTALSPKKKADGEESLLLQHSSGTTGLQKPVLLSNKAVIDHIYTYSNTLNMSSEDKVVSWLPLYHDMGLIAAFHLPLAYGVPSVQIDPFEWVLAPVLLLEAITKEKGTLTWLPNFAYNLMADKIPDDYLKDIRLDSLRMVINCSEPVRNESHQKFLSKFRNYGLKSDTISTCYAMAETTFAVSQTPPGGRVSTVSLNKEKFANGVIETITDCVNSKICVSSGKVIEGCDVKIVNENRIELAPNSIGEVVIKSRSMFDGYRNYPEKTFEVLENGWFYSGDYGFIMDENLYIIGRKKDIIIVAGKNIYPEDVEDSISSVKGIIPGRVIAFGEFVETLGTENVSIAAETKLTDEHDRKSLKIEIMKYGMSMDITINNIYLLPSRWLIKSSAGKPSRKANKERLNNPEERNKWIVK